MKNNSETNNNIYQKNGQSNCQTSFLSRSNSSNTTAMQSFETKPDTGNSIKKLSEGESGSLILSFNLNLCNGKSLITSPVQLITRMLQAQVGGIMTSAMASTGRLLSQVERKFHINVLELKVEKLAIIRFPMSQKIGNSVHVRMDNMAALPNLVKMGETKKVRGAVNQQRDLRLRPVLKNCFCQ